MALSSPPGWKLKVRSKGLILIMSRMLLWLQLPVSRPHLHKPAWQPGNPSQHEPHEAAPGPGRLAQADPHYLGRDVIKHTFLDSWFVLKPARVSKVHELNTTFKKQAKPTFFWSGLLCWCSITVVGIKLKSSSITSLSLVYLLTTSNTSSKELLSVTNMSVTAHCSGRGVGGNCLVSALHVSGTLVTLTGHQEQVCGARGRQHQHCRIPGSRLTKLRCSACLSTVFQMRKAM